MIDHLHRWQELGKAGVIVRITCWKLSNGRPVFSVAAMRRNGNPFAESYTVETFEQAVEIAEKVALERGWLPLNS